MIKKLLPFLLLAAIVILPMKLVSQNTETVKPQNLASGWLDLVNKVILRFQDKNTAEGQIEGKELKLEQEIWLACPQNTPKDSLCYFLNKLAFCESSNNPLAINPDDKGSPSFGLFQYKEKTWEYKIRKYDLLPYATDAELMNFIFDEGLQTYLTKRILKDGGWRHWFNCGRRVGIYRVDFTDLTNYF